MAAIRKTNESSKTRRPPATTPEGRENQLIALAFDLAEKQLTEGTASAQVISNFLKMGTEREKLEREKLRHENHLLATRADQISSSAHMEELYADAIKAMREYKGHEVIEREDDDY